MTAPVAQALTNTVALLPGLVIPKTDADGAAMMFDDVLSALFADGGADNGQLSPGPISPVPAEAVPQWPAGIEDLRVPSDVAEGRAPTAPGDARQDASVEPVIATKISPPDDAHIAHKATALLIRAAAAYAEAAALTKAPLPEATPPAVLEYSNSQQDADLGGTSPQVIAADTDETTLQPETVEPNTSMAGTPLPAPKAQDAPDKTPAESATKPDDVDANFADAPAHPDIINSAYAAEPAISKASVPDLTSQGAQQAAPQIPNIGRVQSDDNGAHPDQSTPAQSTVAVLPIPRSDADATPAESNVNTSNTPAPAATAQTKPAPAIVMASAEAAPAVTPSLLALATDTRRTDPQSTPAKTSSRADSAKMKPASAPPVQPSDEKIDASPALTDAAASKAQDAPRSSPPSYPGNGQNLATPAPQPHTTTPHAYASIDTSSVGLGMPGQATPNAADAPVRFELSTFAGTPIAVSNMDGLALRIAAKSAAGESEFTVRLDPPALGRIEVTLNVNSQGAAQASLSADKPHTLELLQRDAPALERALKDAGLDLAGGLSFSLKSDGQPGDWRNAQAWNQGNPVRINAVDGASTTDMAVPAAAFIATGWGAGNTRLDITV
jgi:hypothetical protein